MDSVRGGENLGLPVAVLGAGNVGRCMAADLSLAGFDVRLWEHPDFATGRTGVPLSDRIRVRWEELSVEEDAGIPLVTTRVEEAIDGAVLLNVTVPAMAHDPVFAAMAPHLRDGQMVVVYPDNFGALRLRNVLSRRGLKPNILVAGTTTPPYGVRVLSSGLVSCAFGYGPRTPTSSAPFPFDFRVAALPAHQTSRVMEVLRPLWRAVEPASSVIETSLGNVNFLLHPLPTILNAARVESSERFLFYRDGYSESVIRGCELVLEEIQAVGAAFHCRPWAHGTRRFAEAFGSVVGEAGESRMIALTGPDRLRHRFLLEDVGFGLNVIAQLGTVVGVGTPTIDAIVTFASFLSGVDLRASGQSLESLGFGDMTGEEIVSVL